MLATELNRPALGADGEREIVLLDSQIGELVVEVSDVVLIRGRLAGEGVERGLSLRQRLSVLVGREQLLDRAHVRTLQRAEELGWTEHGKLVDEREEVLISGDERGTLSLSQGDQVIVAGID